MEHRPTQSVTAEPLAHLTEEGRPHLLVEHLRGVAALAGRFGVRLHAAEWAALAGLWHDLGKYARDFQDRIRTENGFAAHIEGVGTAPRDHSSAGAIHARNRLGALGVPLTFAIAGHHAGLANEEDLLERLEKRTERLEAALQGGAPAEILEATAPTLPAFLRRGAPDERKRRLEMWIRLLFSALCDADFLDTEAFYDDGRAALRQGGEAIATLSERLERHLAALAEAAPPTTVNRVRADVLAACQAAAAAAPGFFSLTAPTGAGKTLAGLAFALAHARRHGLERVIIAIPFTSIIEQTAEVYADVLGPENVLEHHSALAPERETPKSRVSSENWDAPVIVTTTVQLFESLHARRPAACRKLHRLARSVILLDEAQTLPPGLLLPLLEALRTLTEDYGATVVFGTATQPALGRSPALRQGLDGMREIVPPALRAFERLQRVAVRWPAVLDPVPYAALAEEVAQERDVLAIVHRRADARGLTELLDQRLGEPSTIHLSALLCAEHRSRILAQVKERKRRGEPARLVSTQLVEAGVDLDFPVVYRALAGLDALAQAAGRCNREGRIPLGELRVFLAPTPPPRGVPQTARDVARSLLAADPALDLFAPATHRRYFELLYGHCDLDEEGILKERERLRFKEVAERFQLIENDWAEPLVVPYGEAQARVQEIERLGPSRERLRALGRFTVNVPRRWVERWRAAGWVRLAGETVSVLGEDFASAYDERFGLVPERVGTYDPTSLIIDE